MSGNGLDSGCYQKLPDRRSASSIKPAGTIRRGFQPGPSFHRFGPLVNTGMASISSKAALIFNASYTDLSHRPAVRFSPSDFNDLSPLSLSLSISLSHRLFACHVVGD